MALHDYVSTDEVDYYGQGFESDGVVSVWAGVSDLSDAPDSLDILQDLCGVGYYSLDNQESQCLDFAPTQLSKLFSEISYSSSFAGEAIAAAAKLGLTSARWIVVQYDFAYNPQQVKRPVEESAVFLGVFRYDTQS